MCIVLTTTGLNNLQNKINEFILNKSQVIKIFRSRILFEYKKYFENKHINKFNEIVF